MKIDNSEDLIVLDWWGAIGGGAPVPPSGDGIILEDGSVVIRLEDSTDIIIQED